MAGVVADLEFYGLDRNDIDGLYAKINAMTLADAQRVIKQYYPMDNLVFVIIGKASEIGEQVKKYAPKGRHAEDHRSGLCGWHREADSEQVAHYDIIRILPAWLAFC